MTDDELLALVVTMRRHQREFYRLRPEDRPPGLLKQCRDLELRVDKALAARGTGQASLFAPEAHP